MVTARSALVTVFDRAAQEDCIVFKIEPDILAGKFVRDLVLYGFDFRIREEVTGLYLNVIEFLVSTPAARGSRVVAPGAFALIRTSRGLTALPSATSLDATERRSIG